MIYFIRVGQFIKVGYSADALERIRSLQTANPYPIETLAICEGDPGMEADIHRRLAKYRIRGEWFAHADQPIQSIIHELKPVAYLSRAPKEALAFNWFHQSPDQATGAFLVEQIAAAVPLPLGLLRSGWRIEVFRGRNGRRYWQARKRGHDRKAYYGGPLASNPLILSTSANTGKEQS